MIIDSHCHLNYYPEEEIQDIISRAKGSNVGIMQTVCTTIREFPDLLNIANKYPDVYLSVGVHPINAAQGEFVETNEIINLINKNTKVIGIGETGIDLYKCDNLPQQIKSFVAHIEASSQTKLPVIIHARNADNEIQDLLTQEMKYHSFTGVMHSFASSQELAYKALDLGLYISFSGILTFKNAFSIQEIAKNVPHNRVLVETDSPYLTPTPHRGKKNEPAMTKYVVEYLSTIWQKTPEEVAQITTDNFLKLFTKCSINK